MDSIITCLFFLLLHYYEEVIDHIGNRNVYVFLIICLKIMKKLLLFIAGISILFLAGCYNGNQSHGNEEMGDSLPADPPLGYVIELKPLGNFSHQEAEQLREELVKQLGIIFNKVPKAELEASVFVRRQERNTCLMSLQTKKQVLGWGDPENVA